MPEISEELLDSYHRTSYWVFTDSSSNLDDICLRIGEISTELDCLLLELGATQWAFITAHNPHSARLEPVKNNERHKKLLATLADASYTALPARSVADASDWPNEESVLIPEISREAAKRIAMNFGQNGFLYGNTGQPAELVLC